MLPLRCSGAAMEVGAASWRGPSSKSVICAWEVATRPRAATSTSPWRRVGSCASSAAKGPGKSQLLRCIGLDFPPASGSVLVQGVDVTGASSERRRQLRARSIELVHPPAPDGVRDLTVPGTRAGVLIQAGPRATAPVAGMRQRIQIAKALAQGADVLLLDEPLVGVEHGVRARILELLQRLRTETATAVVVATRDPEVAARWPTRSWCSTTARWSNGDPRSRSSNRLATTGPAPWWSPAAPPEGRRRFELRRMDPAQRDPEADLRRRRGIRPMQEERPRRPADESPAPVADGRLAVGHLPGHADHLAPHGRSRPERGRAHGLRLHLEGAPGPVTPGEGGVDGEVHGRVEDQGVDAGLDDAVGVAGQRRWASRPRSTQPRSSPSTP